MAYNPRRTRRVRIEAVLALGADGLARVVARGSRVAVTVLFVFNADSRRDRRNAEHAAAFVNARKCHPDRAARLLRRLARPEGRVKKASKGKAKAKRNTRKAEAKPKTGLRRNGQRRTAAQEAKHAEMRARYQPCAR